MLIHRIFFKVFFVLSTVVDKIACQAPWGCKTGDFRGADI